METINLLVLFALVFSLIGNLYLWFRLRFRDELVADVLTHLNRVRKERDDMEKTIEAIHKMYQKELGKQRDMFCRYWAEKKTEGDG